MSRESDLRKPVYDETALKTFLLHTRIINETVEIKKLDSILTHASNDSIVFRKTVSFLEAPFSNPNSSYRNQSYYSKILQHEIKSKWYSGYEKETASGKLKLLQQNNVGNPANDFSYITPERKKERMYDIKSKNTLLLFYNPECDACKEMKAAMINSKVINSKLKSSELKILAVYTDKDEKVWRDHLSEMPSSWIQGRDEDEYLYKNKIYDLRAIPSLYLLDKNKKVLLKDCTDVSEIEKQLQA